MTWANPPHRNILAVGSQLRARLWPHAVWLGPLLYMMVIGWYFVARYGGNWAEADSSAFALILRAFVDQDRLVPESGPNYPNGYAFQAISAHILALTGLDVATLQQVIYPLLAFVVVLPVWVLFRELTGSPKGAALATILLCIQPDFLFVVLRSSHEKFTRAAMFLCLYLLVRSFKLQTQPRLFAAHVVLFYLSLYAVIASNNLLSHSFIFMIALVPVIGRILHQRITTDPGTTRGRRARRSRSPSTFQLRQLVFQRFHYATIVALAFVYLFVFYIYPPAEHDLRVLKSVWDRIAALYLDVQPHTTTLEPVSYTNPYSVVTEGWINLPVYVLLTAATWLILGTSLLIWLRQAVRWLWQREVPESPTLWLTWLFYAVFGVQGVISLLADTSGALSSNIQLRLLPSFFTFAVVLVAAALAEWRPKRHARLMQTSIALGIGVIAILSILKATNEPLVSNKWTFYRPSEVAALDWSEAHLRNANIWTEYDERLVVALATIRGNSPNHNEFQGYGVQLTTRNMVLSDVTRLRSSRLETGLPVPPDGFRVYDNGEAEVYHLRPETPYQR